MLIYQFAIVVCWTSHTAVKLYSLFLFCVIVSFGLLVACLLLLC